jgi:magnesium-transporting ATPase (P-type)
MVASSVTIIFGFFVWRQTTGVPFALVQSETFTLMVISQWFNVLNCRSAIRTSLSLDVLKNRWLVGGLLLGVALHFLVIYMPSFNRVFHTVPIAPGELLLLVILGMQQRLRHKRQGSRRWRHCIRLYWEFQCHRYQPYPVKHQQDQMSVVQRLLAISKRLKFH